jgi:hypothetical protein
MKSMRELFAASVPFKFQLTCPTLSGTFAFAIPFYDIRPSCGIVDTICAITAETAFALPSREGPETADCS